MRDIPIIFSAPMVRALLREAAKPGTGKTMTRRLASAGAPRASPWRQIQIGDRLWVREAYAVSARHDGSRIVYRADDDEVWLAIDSKWRPSIHCPRAHSRITLVVTATKVERLAEITEADAKAEGAMWHDGLGVGHSGWRHDFNHGYVYKTARWSFLVLWNALHGAGAWDANPEVVALTFKVHAINIDALKVAA